MTRRRIIRPAAQGEIDHQAEYLAQHGSEAVAYRFLAAIDETIALLATTPGLGSLWVSDCPGLQGIRRHKLAGFPNYLLFYRYHDEALEILHLYHGHQDIGTRLRSDADDDEP